MNEQRGPGEQKIGHVRVLIKLRRPLVWPLPALHLDEIMADRKAYLNNQMHVYRRHGECPGLPLEIMEFGEFSWFRASAVWFSPDRNPETPFFVPELEFHCVGARRNIIRLLRPLRKRSVGLRVKAGFGMVEDIIVDEVPENDLDWKTADNAPARYLPLEFANDQRLRFMTQPFEGPLFPPYGLVERDQPMIAGFSLNDVCRSVVEGSA